MKQVRNRLTAGSIVLAVCGGASYAPAAWSASADGRVLEEIVVQGCILDLKDFKHRFLCMTNFKINFRLCYRS